jgi:YD repeat-containing protein
MRQPDFLKIIDRSETFFLPSRLTKQTDVTGIITKFTYDTEQRLQYIDEASGNALERRTEFVYDFWHNVKTRKTPEDSGTADTAQVFDIYGNLTQVTDPVGNITVYTYDEHNRLKTEKAYGTSTAGSPLYTITYAYTTGIGSCGTCGGAGADLVSQRTITDGTNTENLYFKYDLMGRLAQQGTSSAATDITYTYSTTSGRLTEINHASPGLYGNNKLTYSYDDYNRLFKEIYPDNKYVKYLYDTAGRLSSVTDAYGNVNSVGYDSDGRLSSIGNSSGLLTAYFTYNNTTDDLLTLLTQGNGAHTDYGYDTYKRLQSIDNYENPLGVATRMIKFNWSYDPLWRKDSTADITVTSPNTGGKDRIDITYDKASRLTREKLMKVSDSSTAWDIQYTGTGLPYDKAENRQYLNDGAKAYTFTYGAQNRESGVTASPTATPTPVALTYNFKGDVTARKAVVPVSNALDSFVYTWDAYDQLLTATKNGGATVSYAYDAWGRLLSRTKSGTTEYYYYCGMTRITEYTGASMSKTYQFIPGAAVGGVLAMLQPSAATYFAYNDLSTVVAQTDDSARKSGVWVPDFFGNYRYASPTNTRPALGLTGSRMTPMPGCTISARAGMIRNGGIGLARSHQGWMGLICISFFLIII